MSAIQASQLARKQANGKELNFSSVLNKWGKTEIKSEQSIGELYSDITLGIVPFANLTQAQRAKLTALIRDKKVYEIDYNNVQKFTERGRPIYSYVC